MMKPTTAYVGLGSNLGDREALIRRALDMLDRPPQVRVLRVSRLLANLAVGGPHDSPQFLNAAAEVQTTLPPAQLLERMLEIERHLGRDRRERWAPRTIDLDLLLYGEQVIDEPTLHIPHPLMHERRFVLQPLADIAPGVLHPVLKKTASQLLASLQARE